MSSGEARLATARSRTGQDDPSVCPASLARQHGMRPHRSFGRFGLLPGSLLSIASENSLVRISAGAGRDEPGGPAELSLACVAWASHVSDRWLKLLDAGHAGVAEIFWPAGRA